MTKVDIELFFVRHADGTTQRADNSSIAEVAKVKLEQDQELARKLRLTSVSDINTSPGPLGVQETPLTPNTNNIKPYIASVERENERNKKDAS